MSKSGELAQALIELNESKVAALVKAGIEGGQSALEIIKECNEGMTRVGRLFESGEWFISELIMAGHIMKTVTATLEPLMGAGQTASFRGKVIIGTVKDDIHDIGKNIVITLLKGTGFEVIDLGVDVPAAGFVSAVHETGAKVLGLSALLTLAYPRMKEVVEALNAAGLREQVKVIIGGAPCNESVRQFAGADFYARDAGDGVRICQEILAAG